MALEDGEYRIRESKSVIGYFKKKNKKQIQDQITSFVNLYKEKKNDSTVFCGLSVHLVLVQSDNNKTELPAETRAEGIADHTPRETHTNLLKLQSTLK